MSTFIAKPTTELNADIQLQNFKKKPQTSAAQVSFLLPVRVHSAFKKYAIDHEINMNDFFNDEVCRRYYDERFPEVYKQKN